MHGDDVRVVQPGDGAGFVEEQPVQRQAFRRVDVELQGLDGHRAREQRIPGLVHVAQATFAQLALERVAADVLQRGFGGQLVGRRRLAVQRQRFGGFRPAPVHRRRQRSHRRGEVGVAGILRRAFGV